MTSLGSDDERGLGDARVEELTAAEQVGFPPAIFIMGPTASGKTALAFELARRLHVDIVSVDSAQVFRDMNIGTAKPDSATLAEFPHRLIDLITPEERYSAARFCADARREMATITAHGRVPLLVGGTMLYFKALREGLADLPDADTAVRAAIDEQAKIHGWPALHAELAREDPVTAARLAPNDAQRIQRALEVLRLSGRPLNDFHVAQRKSVLPYRVLAFGLMPQDRAALHARIAERFNTMLRQGLIEEVEALREKYRLEAALPSMRCVGYREVFDMLEGRLARPDMVTRAIAATRQFAKRQLTWLRTMPSIEQLDAFDAGVGAQIIDRARRLVDG